MSDQTANAVTAFETALAAFANRLVVNDAIWNLAFKAARLSFDRSTYETSDDGLTVAKAEAELNRQLEAYTKAFNEGGTGTRAAFLHEGNVDEFLEMWTSLQRLVAAAEAVPPSHRPIVDGLSLPRFLENVEFILKGSINQLHNPQYEAMNIPYWRD